MIFKKIFQLFFTGIPFLGIAQSPALFEPGNLSKHGEFGLTISPDGLQAAWVQSNGGRDSLIIMESRKVDGHWQAPRVAEFSGKLASGWKDIDPMFTPDGTQVIFQSTRPVPGKPNRKGFDIWAVKKSGDSWLEPFHLGNQLNSDSSESFASVAKSGTIYFMKANEDGIGKSDIYYSNYVNGAYQSPVNIGAPINTSFRESNPFIDPDENYLLFFSDDSTGLGEVDLYVSFRQDGRWTIPQNLGSSVNSSTGEFCPFVHLLENRLYFSRHTRAGKRFIEDLFYYEKFNVLLQALKQSAKLPGR